MEEYYQKVIQLQERLRQSEEERLKLEMKFNEMLQVMKEEEEAHFKKLRTKYKQFLDEDRRRQQRNDKILEALDRIENRSQIWEAKTEKFKEFRKRYQDYFKHANGRRSRSPFEAERAPEPKHQDTTYNERPINVYPERNPQKDSGGDVKNDIMEKYLQSLSSQKCKDDVLQKRHSEIIPPPESKYSNLGNINSIYWKNPKSGEKTDLEKEDKCDSTQLKNNKDMENALKQNINDYSYGGDKTYDDVPSFERKPLLESNYDTYSPGRKLSTEPEMKNQNFSSNINPLTKETIRRTSQQLAEEPQARSLNVHNDLENLLKQHKDEVQNPLLQLNRQPIPQQVPLPTPKKHNIQPISRQPPNTSNTPLAQLPPRQIEKTNEQIAIKSHLISNPQSFDRPIENDYQKQPPPQQLQRRPSQAYKSEFDQIQPLIQKELPIVTEQENKVLERKASIIEKVETELPPQPYHDQEEKPDQNLEKQYYFPEQQYEGQGYDTNVQPLQDETNIQPAQEIDNNGQQYYNESGQPLEQYTKSDEPLQQYDENGQALQQYDQAGQPLQQYDENGQPLHQYDKGGQPLQQYDQAGQPLQQYDKNGQPLQQYNEGGQQLQQYDENGQPLQQYDENSQPLQQYDQAGQPLPQYDQAGPPLQQYDENGQPLQQFYDEAGLVQSQYYDENGQPLQKYDENNQQYYENTGQAQQYDENGQPITQYDENGQPILQYDEHGQPIAQYDENGQPIGYDPNVQPIQYDENGQPITQYDENGQPIIQYDQNGQPLAQYDVNGQPLQQYYDETGQPIQYYGEGGESVQQYDENGQPIQQQQYNNNSEQPYGDEQQYYEQPQQPQEEQPQVETKSNVLEMLETDTESTKQDTKVSNESDFDFSNG